MVRFVAFLLSLVMLGLLYLMLQRTKFGRSVRATVQNPMSAQLLGRQLQAGVGDRVRARRRDGSSGRRGLRNAELRSTPAATTTSSAGC